MVFSRSDYLLLPKEPGVYLFLDKNNNILYVGKARDLKNRVSSYFVKGLFLGPKTYALVSRIKKIRIVLVGSEIESLLLEASFIKKHNPPFNVRMTDGKSYLLIKITIKDKYPKVLIGRRIDDPYSLYFGPYPNSKALRLFLKATRKIFSFVSVQNHPKKICLYHHLGLCPCPPVFHSKQLQKSYFKNIKYLICFLEGNARSIIKEFEKERNRLSKSENFEEAYEIQRKIDAINIIITPVHKPFEYEVNPNLRSDLRLKELKELKMVLKDKVALNSSLKRIECFDVSNISGKLATGSMVVFIKGEKDSSFYRRFRINFNRHSGKRSASRISSDADSRQVRIVPNDFAMIEEVIQRRIRHFEDWGKPDLIIVDGGKGQVSVAIKTLKRNNIQIPLIGLAKRHDTIITESFKQINLPKDSPALHLIQRIRDEAHRFAITYHRKLRSNYLNLPYCRYNSDTGSE